MKWWKWIAIPVAVSLLGVLAFLVVGILAGLLFPATTGIARRVERTHAENTAQNLGHAISAYHTEYQSYPVPDPGKDTTIDSTNALMDVLLGAKGHTAPGGRNVRGVVFYSDRRARPTSAGGFRKGISPRAGGGGTLWDPWGGHYRIRYDSDGNGRVENPEVPRTTTILPETILIWSAGPDGDFDTWADNVKSW